MCRYAFKIYKPHMVCFNCRITLKITDQCPHCRQQMVNMGLDFKAPRRTNLREWKRVHLIYLSGFRYSSCGCWGPGNPAPTLREAKALLEERWADNPIDRSDLRSTSRKISRASSHKVCFDCRLTFKNITVCPQCRRELSSVETKFKFRTYKNAQR